MGNDALIGAPPSLLIGGSESRSILQPRRPNVDDINGHGVSLTRVAAFGKGVVAIIPSGVTLRHACGARGGGRSGDVFGDALALGLLALVGIEVALAQADRLRRNLDQLVVGDIGKRAL